MSLGSLYKATDQQCLLCIVSYWNLVPYFSTYLLATSYTGYGKRDRRSSKLHRIDRFYATESRHTWPTKPAHGPLARYVKLRVAHAPGMPGTFSPSHRVSDPGTCLMHLLRCMPGSLTSGFLPLKSVAGKTFPAFPVHAQPTILRIWQVAHGGLK